MRISSKPPSLKQRSPSEPKLNRAFVKFYCGLMNYLLGRTKITEFSFKRSHRRRSYNAVTSLMFILVGSLIVLGDYQNMIYQAGFGPNREMMSTADIIVIGTDPVVTEMGTTVFRIEKTVVGDDQGSKLEAKVNDIDLTSSCYLILIYTDEAENYTDVRCFEYPSIKDIENFLEYMSH